MEPPSGVVTLLFTEIESSMQLWTADVDAMAASLALHDRLLSTEIESEHGYVFARAGGSFSAAFTDNGAALMAAHRCQQGLAGASWPGPRLRVKIGLHRGEVHVRDGEYFGRTVGLTASVVASGHGDQLVATSSVLAASRPAGQIRSLGSYALRGESELVELHQIGGADFPALRAERTVSDTVRFDDVELDLRARRLSVDGLDVAVEPQVLDVLIHLVENRDRLIAREELLDEVWGDQFVSMSALTTRIKQARQALGDDGRTQRYIRNERGRGYQFVGDVVEQTAADTGRTPNTMSAEAARRTTSVFGRADDRRALEELMSEAPLTTVVGPGGVGKTTLVHSLLDEWESNGRSAVFAPLDGVRDDSGLIPALMTTFGLSGTVDDRAIEACADWLRATESVLVLDNCEHLLPAVRSFVSELVEMAPDVSILATSRQSLGLSSESVFRLRPLELPGSSTGVDVADWPCLQLFEAAARRAGGMQITGEDDWREVIELCRSLDGLPLAIELAASRLSSLGLRDLVGGLDDRLDWFRNRDVDADARQRSLRSTVEWSFRFLDDEGTRLVAALALFPAGLVFADVRALVDLLDVVSEADEIIAGLVDASVLTLATNEDETRYAMLETIRQFGLERLERDPALAQVARQHVIDHALSISQVERDHWTGDRDASERSLARLRTEIPNLRAARELMLKRNDAAGAVRLAVGLCAFTEEMCLAELWSWHDIDHIDGEFDDQAEAARLLLKATASRNQGDVAASLTAAEAAANLTDDRWIVGRAKHTAAMAAMYDGAIDDTVDLWLESDVQLGGCRGRLFAAMAAALGGDISRATTLLRECEVDERSRVPVDLFANIHLVRGELARIADTGNAKHEFERSLAIAQHHGLAFSTGIAQGLLVRVLEAEGDTAGAAHAYRELLELFVRTGTWPQIWITLRNAARLLVDAEPETALLISAAASLDNSVPTFDEVVELAERELRDAVLSRLGSHDVDRIERRASLTSRVDVVRETADALRRLS